ncbi:MAG: DUF2252 family protein [Myxococcota bacterium]
MEEDRSPLRRALFVQLLVAAAVAALGCAETGDSRAAFVRTQIARADQSLIRQRRDLVAGKYARMARTLYDYYRGSVPVFAADFANGAEAASATTARSAPLVLTTGDAHPENFGLLLGADGVLALEPNDFDSADQYPFTWDLRRLATGLVLGVRRSAGEAPTGEAHASDALTDAVVRTMVANYVQAVAAHADGAPRRRFEREFVFALAGQNGGSLAIFEDLFSRGDRDVLGRRAIRNATELTPEGRRILRGVDPEDPEHLYQDLPPSTFAELPATLAAYRRTLLDPPEVAYFTVLDAARELGSGVASWPRIRAQVLLRGPTDGDQDDVLVEVKELTDSAALGWLLPQRYYGSVGERILSTSRALWAVPSAERLWGVSSWVGLPVQLRLEEDGQKTIRTRRFEGDRAEPAALEALARVLGQLLARMHATPPDLQRAGDGQNAAAAIRDAVDVPDFDADEARFAIAYAGRVESDFLLWQRLVVSGEALELPSAEEDRASAAQRALFGTPAPPLLPELPERPDDR